MPGQRKSRRKGLKLIRPAQSAVTALVPVQKPSDLNRLHYFYSIARALHRGQQGRPGLPPELVLYISRLCRLSRIEPSPILSLRWLPENAPPDEVDSQDSSISDKLWCTTPPLSEWFLEQVHTIRLVTVSKDQGWCSNPKQGSWSWFDVGILQRSITIQANTSSSADHGVSEETQMPRDTENPTLGLTLVNQGSDFTTKVDPSSGGPLRWHSHNNEISTKEFKVHVGKEIGPEHGIWRHLQPGDQLGVWINARFPGWACYGKHAEIQVWEIWQPKLM